MLCGAARSGVAAHPFRPRCAWTSRVRTALGCDARGRLGEAGKGHLGVRFLSVDSKL